MAEYKQPTNSTNKDIIERDKELRRLFSSQSTDIQTIIQAINLIAQSSTGGGNGGATSNPPLLTLDPRGGVQLNYIGRQLMNSFYRLPIRDFNTIIARDSLYNMTFTDTNVGTVTLADLLGGSGGYVPGYTESFTSSATWTVTHSLGSTDVIAQAWIGNELITPDKVDITDSNTVTMTFSDAVSGVANVVALDYSSRTKIGKYSETISTAATTWTLSHNLGNRNVIVQLWDSNDEQFDADVVVTDANTVTVTLSNSLAGKATIVALPVNGVYFYTSAVASASTWTITHGLGTYNLIVQLYDSSYNLMEADTVAATDSDTVTVTLGESVAGYINIMGIR